MAPQHPSRRHTCTPYTLSSQLAPRACRIYHRTRQICQCHREEGLIRLKSQGRFLIDPPCLPQSLYMADPLSVSTGIISLITLAIKLVVGAAGMIDKTAIAYREAANELQVLQSDLERLEMQMDHIHRTLQFLATDTKDRAFRKLLQEYVGLASLT